MGLDMKRSLLPVLLEYRQAGSGASWYRGLPGLGPVCEPFSWMPALETNHVFRIPATGALTAHRLTAKCRALTTPAQVAEW
jgi:hypothetical protein